MCPHSITKSKLKPFIVKKEDRHMLTKERATWKARYISDSMKDAKKNQMFFAPYNAKKHWMLCVLNPYKETVYWFDPLRFQVMDDFKNIIESAMKMWLAQINLNRPKKSVKWIEGKCPRQLNNTDCGYYVLSYIFDIIRMEQESYSGESYQQYGSNPLTKDKIDEVRDQWVSFVQNFML